MEYPAEIIEFLNCLTEDGEDRKPQIEPGGVQAGDWWMDFPNFTVHWRPHLGFGFSLHGEATFGEGPSEIYKGARISARRAVQLLSSPVNQPANTLGSIRELLGLTQEQLAARLNKKQAAVSKLEARKDSRVETLSEVVEALGGHLEVRAIFPEASLPLYRRVIEEESEKRSLKVAEE